MFSFLRNKYILSYFIVYFISFFLLYFKFHQPLSDLLPVFICFGIILSGIAWLLVKDYVPAVPEKPPFKSEWFIIPFLILYFLFYVTYGTFYITKLLPASITESGWKNEIVVTVKKLFIFVLIPFLVYKSFGFSLKDFGLRLYNKELFGRKSILVFTVLSIAVLLFQYFFGGVIRAPL